MYLSAVKHPFRMMKYPKMFYHFYFVNLAKVAAAKFKGKNLYLDNAKKQGCTLDRAFLSNETFNDRLKTRIASNEAFFCCRYGNSELTACFFSQLRELGIIDEISSELLRKAKSGPGVFPEKESVYLAFAKTYTDALRSADYNAYWGNVLMEEFLLASVLPAECEQMTMRALEPFQYDVPWTTALSGKKVLVVHPFAEIIEQQYKKRKDIFPHKEILPDFQLETVASIQSSGENVPVGYAEWEEALDALYERCATKDFDVALLSCGSYAVPLGARLKASGKKAIVLGGMMQRMFGIKGARWEESRPDIVALYNDAWVRAGGQYKVKAAESMVDGAAYW